MFAREALEMRIPAWMREQIESVQLKGTGRQDSTPPGKEDTTPVVVEVEQGAGQEPPSGQGKKPKLA